MKKSFLLICFLLFSACWVAKAQYKVLFNFNGQGMGGIPVGNLLVSGNVMYGINAMSGSGGGYIFSIHTDGTGFKDLYDFTGEMGTTLFGGLVLSGKTLYGMSMFGVNYPYGCIYCVDTDGANFKDLLDFNGKNGETPTGGLTLAGNVLYGVTELGGANTSGNVFSIHTDGTGYKDLMDFNDTSSKSANLPIGTLVLSGKILYGASAKGGASGQGNIFSINTDGTAYTDLLDFDDSNGANPYGSLTLSGDTLYGQTQTGYGNTSFFGNVFSIRTDGTGFKGLLQHVDVPGISVLVSGNKIYGAEQGGGANAVGFVYSMNIDGSGFKDIGDFSGYNGAGAQGVVLLGNKLICMAEVNLFNSPGAIYTLDTDSAGVTDFYDFQSTVASGATPYGSLTLSGNLLYGMTNKGGANNLGCVFSVDTAGNGFADLLDFDGSNGQNPYGDLTLSGGVLYGMATRGGGKGYGCIFSLDTDGTNYSDIHDFDSVHGANPHGALIFLGGGNVLYGMARNGGANGFGCIFSMNTGTSTFTDIYDFNNTDGANPNGSLTLFMGKLYGTTWTSSGGDPGCVFSINPDGSEYKILIFVNFIDGDWNPNSSVIISGNTLFGTTTGRSALDGAVFAIDINGDSSNLVGFNGSNGAFPYGSLTISGNTLYGMTLAGAANNKGNIFSVNTDGSGFTDLVDFNGANGAAPYGSLTLSGDKFYGMTSAGGAGGLGVVFRYSAGTAGINAAIPAICSTKLYPNPNNGKFTIENSAANGKSILTVYNMMGEEILSSELTGKSCQIDMSNQPAGIYIYSLISDNGELYGQGKIVVEK